MATRVVNGNSFSENGWPLVDANGCDPVKIPRIGISVPVQTGQPNTILKAFMADLHKYVEEYNGEGDIGGWTDGNSVLGQPGKNNGSNHLGGTAVDYNWNDHPMGPKVPDPNAGWQGSSIIDGPQEPMIRKLLTYYTADDGTKLVFWGNDWDSPHDSMHFQMGYSTYNNPAVGRWIDNNIDTATMTSKFGQNATPSQPVDVGFDRAAAANALYLAVEDFGQDDAARLLDPIVAGLAQANCNTVNRIAMWFAQVGHESDDFKALEEYGKGAGKPYYPYYGRTWIQITWQSNYAAFGAWCAAKGLVTDANVFVNNPASLADIKWAGIGPAWFWLANHGGHNLINVDADNGDIVAVTQTINGGQKNIDDRRARYAHALAVGDALLKLIPTSTPTNGGNVTQPQSQLDRIEAKLDQVLAQLGPKEADWTPDSSFGQNANGDELTFRDGMAEFKREFEATLSKPATAKAEAVKVSNK